MKKVALAVLVFVLAAWIQISYGQDSPTGKLYEKYNGKEGYTTVSISKDLFTMFADMQADNDTLKEVKEMMNQLDGIRILMYETEAENDAELARFKDEISKFNLAGFSELMVVQEKDEKVKFMSKKSGDKISELLLIISSGKEAGFISITGLIDLKTVSKLSKTMNFEGMENLQKLEEKK